MASISKDITINAPLDAVWKVARAFESIHEWHPAIESLKMVEGEEEPRRILTLGNGALADERLVELDDDKHIHTYIILDSPIPLTDYRATINVQSEGTQSRVNWSATYKPNPGEDAACEKIVSGVFESGLEALKQQLES
ncbi:SRPBCC family protein [Candidatus Poribacteria bacterium]